MTVSKAMLVMMVDAVKEVVTGARVVVTVICEKLLLAKGGRKILHRCYLLWLMLQLDSSLWSKWK